MRNAIVMACCGLFACLIISAARGEDEPARARRAKTEKGQGSFKYPPQMPGATAEVYKQVGDVKLQLYVFAPSKRASGERRPAIVFFFGGGWSSGSPAQFQPHCEYLAQRGMVAITADYRVATRHGVKAIDCVRDAKSAIRWVRREAGRLGVDPDRLAAAGGSAGGHLAACTGVIDGLDEADEDLAISSRPNALVLFNPPLVLAEFDGLPPRTAERLARVADRLGTEPRRLSPVHHVQAGAPPTIIFHGRADTTVPFDTAEAFTAVMKQSGGRCELVGYDGQEHGFFNLGRNDGEYFRRTVAAMDEFLVSLGYLKPGG